MRNSQLQTPQRDQTPANRRPTTASDLNRNLRKGVTKSLNPQFKAESEDDSFLLDSLKEFPEAPDHSPFSETAENCITSASEAHSSEIVDVLHPTSIESSSATATPYKHVAPEVHSFEMIRSIEAELVIKHLKDARIQVLKSNDVDPSKKLVEALISIIIDELHDRLHEKNECHDKLLCRMSSLGFLISIMWLLYLSVVWFLNWSSEGSFSRLPPT